VGVFCFSIFLLYIWFVIRIEMKKTLTAVLSYLSMFMIGAYFTSQFKFDTPIEGYRWMMTGFFFLFFVVATFNTKERNENN